MISKDVHIVPLFDQESLQYQAYFSSEKISGVNLGAVFNGESFGDGNFLGERAAWFFREAAGSHAHQEIVDNYFGQYHALLRVTVGTSMSVGARFIAPEEMVLSAPRWGMLSSGEGLGLTLETETISMSKIIPESPRALPPSAEKAFTWTESVKNAGTGLISGRIFVNPNVWRVLTMGQKSTLFWEEISHQGRVVGVPMWMRKVNSWLYENTSLGKFLEESMAHSFAMNSIPKGIRYGWEYEGVNKGAVVFQGGLLFVAPPALGYLGGKVLSGD